ncbi:hypothetical protein AWENTII_001398 [Aspergillus wentii]
MPRCCASHSLCDSSLFLLLSTALRGFVLLESSIMEAASSTLDDVIPIKSDAILSTAIEHGSYMTSPSDSETQHATSTNLRRAHTVAQGGNIARRNMETRAARERAVTSLLRVKDSHELLRRRSLTRSNTRRALRDTLAGVRDANHFTVGNVGQNGKIFLRPIRNLSRKEARPSPTLASSSANKPAEKHLHPHTHAHGGNDPARWSNSQLSELRPGQVPGEDAGEEDDSVLADSLPSEYPPNHRQRAHSFSTLSEHQSACAARSPGEFRIVIDRSEDRPKSADGLHRPPTLETHIPSYRLGTPQFNNEGSAALHSSVYTRTSISDNFRASRFLRENSPLPNVYLDPSQPDRPSFAASMFSGPIAIEIGGTPGIPENPVVYELKEPIEPSVFEELMSDMDGGSVVRYIPGTKDISAATPARIVAQISSESFMDYELVSDFFLTFRCYLSTNTLLALLLARLQWAINRLQDDGRIIRIRTFAALRHWILNYFVDDFVINYDLRSQFCETINAMYDDVKARETGGLSDLKILIDLKRCWHGKCSLYWEFSDFHSAYQNPDNPISPGEVLGSMDGDNRSSTGRYQSVAHSDLAANTGYGTHRADPSEIERLPHTVHHDRNGSSATAKSIPASTKSEQSFHATSCSLPPKSPKRLSMPFPKGKAPHPVPLIPAKYASASQESSPVSPALSKRHPFHTHAHKRSGSFSDSVRDGRAPLSLQKMDQLGISSSQELLNPGSLIRGELYAPAESYMTMMAPPSPPLPSSSSNAGSDRRNTSDGTSKPTSAHSGVKTIIGSIRRALNSRSGGSTSQRTGNGFPGQSLRGKTSAMPTNVAFGSDLYRDRKNTAMARRPVRLDVLCDEVLKHYRNAFAPYDGSKGDPPQTASTFRFQATLQEPENAPRQTLAPDGGTARTARSELTMGSESIVIVDDTGFDFATMTGGAMPGAGLEQAPTFLNTEDSPTTPKPFSFGFSSKNSSRADDEYSLPIYYDDTGSGVPSRLSKFLRPSGTSDSRRSYSVERGSASRNGTPPSLRLRKYASFQSGVSKSRLSMGSEVPPATADSNTSQRNSEKPVGPILRRRPGGDLRKMQTGVEPRSYNSSGSFRSHASYYSSMADSTASAPGDQASRPQTSLVPPNPRFSLIHTHSQQNMRRSFEAAIAQFAQIPDDGDGGIESTLLKLEGKWDGQPGAAVPKRLQPSAYGRNGTRGFDPSNPASGGLLSRRHQTLLGDSLTYSQIGGRLLPQRPYSDSVAESEDSYSSIPLLERGLSDESMKKPALARITSVPAASRTHLNDIARRDTSDMGSSRQSFDIVKETESLRRIPRGSTLPRQSIGSSSLAESAVEIPPHPLAHPPSPPMSIQNPRSITSCATPLNPVLFQAQPPTPDPSPRRNVGHEHARSINMQQASGDVLSKSETDRQNQQGVNGPSPDHVPFILSCESHVLAQQLTLVEMAALSEVDWRDLVDMRWSSGSPSMLNWVQFLSEEDHRGIDLVVGRFNLMVKWVLSEIVLTQDIHERARTISKFIHTAAHAKRICNYATMLQIAIALSSTDCSRLQKTWTLVPQEDRRVLKDMESLIQPVRNFHDLRVEMETANLQDGCIPFVGLYVHDLTYNAQKPAQISNTEGEPLVNFERYRTAARIVKNLLRLIDASTKYNFQPVQGIIERCLWIASLSEEQIQTRSKILD